jgi:uncharacterized membrane-anchored protein YhcB (DUF1043 family)
LGTVTRKENVETPAGFFRDYLFWALVSLAVVVGVAYAILREARLSKKLAQLRAQKENLEQLVRDFVEEKQRPPP